MRRPRSGNCRYNGGPARCGVSNRCENDKLQDAFPAQRSMSDVLKPVLVWSGTGNVEWIVAASERCMFGLFVGRSMLMCLCKLCRADERVCLMLFRDDCDALVCKRWRFIIWRMNLLGCGKWWTELAG